MREALLQLIHDVQAAERSRSYDQVRKQLMQVPPETTLNSGSLADQILTMVDEKAKSPSFAVQLGDGQARFT